MNAFVTLTHDDPEFRKYLLGSFSSTLRALPVESFNQHSNRERVTFRIIEVAELNRPPWWKIYFKACRPELLGLTLAPFLIAAIWMMRLTESMIVNPLSFAAAVCGLFFLHVSAFLLNDFRDHMHGVDFANRRRGSQVIQKGWASARAVRGWAGVNAGLALMCGLPALWLNWNTLLPIVIVAAAIVIALSWISSRLAKAGISDLLVFFGLGPMLTMAGSIVAFGEIPGSVILLGTAFGGLAVLTLQIRQLENLFRAGKDSFRTFIGGFEFDRAKTMVLSQIILVGGLQLMIAALILPNILALLGFIFASVPLATLFARVRRAASPISSDLVRLGRHVILSHLTLLAWWGIAVWI